MKISIGNDHGGFLLKQEILKYLFDNNIQVIDEGCHNLESCDYPEFAIKVAKDVQSKNCDFGILICTTGIGMSISANKCKGVRAALVNNLESAHLTRQHNDSNIICLGAKYISTQEAISFIEAFINEQFEDGRHANRVKMITKQEEKWEN